MPNFTAGTSFTDGVTNDVTALKLNALVADAVPTSSLALTSTNGTIANFTSSTANITLGTIPTLTAGTTTGTAGVFTSGTITTGVIPTLTAGTTTSTNAVVTNGTITNLSATTSTFLGTITGSTNVVNIGSGQIYKDASGNVGVGTASPAAKLDVRAADAAGQMQLTATTGTNAAYALFQNTSGAFIVGRDNSVGGNLVGAPYSSSLYSQGPYPMVFCTDSVERLRIGESGNVGIGAASPATTLNVEKSSTSGNVSLLPAIRLRNTNASLGDNSSTFNYSLIQVQSGNGTVNSSYGARYDSGFSGIYFGTESSHPLTLQTAGVERLRIDSSGNVLVGKTSPSTSTVGFQFDLANNKIACGANGSSTALFNRNGDDGAVVQIARDGVEKGTISVTTTAVAYNTSSDYRLKTNLEPIFNGIERVKQLPVYRFNWISDQSGNKVDGFVAHEARAIVPECVTGEKDAVDADGKPIYQGIDQSKIVPLLTAALKEAIAKIETLEAKVTALEAA